MCKSKTFNFQNLLFANVEGSSESTQNKNVTLRKLKEEMMKNGRVISNYSIFNLSRAWSSSREVGRFSGDNSRH
jgi:hypothetical protein